MAESVSASVSDNVGYYMYAGKEMERIARYLSRHKMVVPPRPLTLVAMTAEVDDGGTLDPSAAPGERSIVRVILLQLMPLIEVTEGLPGYGHTLRPLFRSMETFIRESDPPRVLMHTQNRAMRMMLKMTEGVTEFPEAEFFFNWSPKTGEGPGDKDETPPVVKEVTPCA